MLVAIRFASRGDDMNVRLLLASAVLVLLSSCQTTAPAPAATPLDGAWEIVSATFRSSAGTTSTARSPQIRSLKVLNDGRFSFVTVRQDGTLGRASAGRYTVSGSTYTETIDISDSAAAVGTTYT